MNQTSSRIRTLLPYALPGALAVVASVLVFTGGRKHVETSSVLSHTASPASVSPRQLREEPIGVPVSGILRDLAPADVRVAEHLEQYKAGDKSVTVSEMLSLAARPQGKSVRFSVAGMDLSGVVTSRKEENGDVSLAVRLDDELGRFTLSLRAAHRAYATLFFEGEHHAFAFHGYPQDNRWQVTHKTVENLLCSPAGSTYTSKRQPVGMPRAKSAASDAPARVGPVAAPPDLESDPESTYVIYIDLDGEIVNQPEWSDQTIDAEPHPRADDVDFVTRVWERVSEDFAPFDINVTTSRAVFDAAAPTRRMMCVATPDDTAAPGAGGVAYLNSFGSGLVCWAFNPTEDTLADTVSHEIGHTLGLSHDGKVNVYEYYGGHGTGEVSWAPIMGAFFADFEPPYVNEELTQWSKGEYTDATNQEDDLQIITSNNGFGYRDDDYGNTSEESTLLPINEGEVDGRGVIERTTDEDWFRFATSGGTVTITADTYDIESPDAETNGSNLALSVTLYNSKGVPIVSDNPDNIRGAEITKSLAKGTYFVKIEGEGRLDPDTGFTDYASLGRYILSGNVPQDGILRIDPTEAQIPRNGGSAEFGVYSDRQWTWSCDASWISSDSPIKNSGNGNIFYEVARNPNRNPRTAEIKVSTDGFEVIHLVKQDGSLGDDHGDTFDEATPVTQVSTTAGNLEEPYDVDVFLVQIEGFGDLTVRTTGTTDTYADFYGVNEVRRASDDDLAKPNFIITQRVSSGSYYVKVRHSVRGGIGKYTLECTFRKRPALIINPVSRKAGPSGGRFLIDVISNTDWTWSTDVPWIKSSTGQSQNRGQAFAYSVDPHNGGMERRGRIIFENKGNRVVHTVRQRPANDDDHSNRRAEATVLASNGQDRGLIQFEGDADLFRIELNTSGLLEVTSTGNTDTVGELLDGRGNSILVADDADNDNFRIGKAVGAGTYFVRVTSFGGVQVGSYRINSTFTPSKLVDVLYTAGKGGYVRGQLSQSVPLRGDASTVTAVPKEGFSFHRWSDGLLTPKRSDLDLVTHVQVTAEFVGTIKVSDRRGEIRRNEPVPVDFHTVPFGDSRTKEFTIRNRGITPLTNVRISLDGFDTTHWRVSKPSRTTLQPGKSATFRVSLLGRTTGFHSTQWVIRANGLDKSFILRTMGVVERTQIMASQSTSASSKSSGPNVGLKSATSALRLPWIDASPDGYFRYRFERAAGDATEQQFWISADAVHWEEALALDVWKTHTSPGANHFEAIFAPPLIPAPRILVNESSP